MQRERYKDMEVAHMGVNIQINNKSTKQRLIDLIYGGLISRWTTRYSYNNMLTQRGVHYAF